MLSYYIELEVIMHTLEALKVSAAALSDFAPAPMQLSTYYIAICNILSRLLARCTTVFLIFDISPTTYLILNSS